MASYVDIANATCFKLGWDEIHSLDDDLEQARKIKARYQLIRDAELRRRKWNFSIMEAEIAADATAPLPPYARRFALPGDCLRVIQVGEYAVGVNLADYTAVSTPDYRLQGRWIHTNLSAPLTLRYIGRIVEPGLFDPCFAEAYASRMAYELCERGTASAAKRQLAWNDYRMAIKEGVTSNALERASESIPDDTWIAARRG